MSREYSARLILVMARWIFAGSREGLFDLPITIELCCKKGTIRV